MPRTTFQVFVDGGYLRSVAKNSDNALMNPSRILDGILGYRATRLDITRYTYYDALLDDEEKHDEIKSYWRALELEDNTHLGFGSLRGKKPQRQKGVDVLLAVQMLAGAYHKNFDTAVLIAGDADFVPVVEEVHRNGVNVFLVASEIHGAVVADDLKRAVDEVQFLDGALDHGNPENLALIRDGEYWIYEGEQVIRRPTK